MAPEAPPARLPAAGAVPSPDRNDNHGCRLTSALLRRISCSCALTTRPVLWSLMQFFTIAGVWACRARPGDQTFPQSEPALPGTSSPCRWPAPDVPRFCCNRNANAGKSSDLREKSISDLRLIAVSFSDLSSASYFRHHCRPRLICSVHSACPRHEWR